MSLNFRQPIFKKLIFVHVHYFEEGGGGGGGSEDNIQLRLCIEKSFYS